MSQQRLQNLLGALSLAVVDRMNSENRNFSDFGGETAAAIVQIGTQPDLTIMSLCQTIGLTHSATTRVVGKLAERGIVVKTVGEDAREVRLSLSADGRDLMTAILNGRQKTLAGFLDALAPDEQSALERVFEKILSRAPRDEVDAHHICRLCNERVCPQDRCPVTTL